MMRRESPGIALALGLLVCATVRAQESTPAVAAEVVRLDVIVTDAHGGPVDRLEAEDFAVFEDGQPQRLTDFAFAGSGSAATPLASGEPGATSGNAPGRRRYLAIVVDEPHLSQHGVRAAKEALRHLLAEVASPDDEIALVRVGSPARTAALTRDRVALRQAVEHIRSRSDSIATGQGAQLTAEQAEQILRGDPAALQLAARLLMDEPGSVLSGSIVPRNMSSGPVPAGIEANQKGAALEAERQARAVLAEALSISESTLATVERVLRRMASLPGRRLCLLVSDGFLVGRGTSEEQTRRLRQVNDAATRSGVAVYPLLAASLAPIGGDASSPGSAGPAGLRDRVAMAAGRQRTETLQHLADDTGGFLLRGSEAVASGLAGMLRDEASLYLLAYEPSNQKRDGRYRRLVVRTPRHRGYVVRTRRGYFAPNARKLAQQHAPAAAWRPLSSAEARLALAARPPQAGIPMGVSADYLELAGGPQVVVKAQVDPAGLPWRQQRERQRAELDLVGAIYDSDGNLVGSSLMGRHYTFDVGPAEHDALEDEGVHYGAVLPLTPGRYRVRMVALGPGRVPLGEAGQHVDVPDVAQNVLTLSSVFLSSASGVTVDGRSASERTVRDAQALRRFKASDTLGFQFYVYNATRDGVGASDVVLQAQIRSAGQTLFASKPQRALLEWKDGIPLPEGDSTSLARLAPGGYELRIVVEDRKARATASRSLEFTVE